METPGDGMYRRIVHSEYRVGFAQIPCQKQYLTWSRSKSKSVNNGSNCNLQVQADHRPPIRSQYAIVQSC